MERVQFPIKLCFGITANKSQGQTYKRVGINLSDTEMFSHGQLYVALSRVGSSKAVSIFKPKGHPNPNYMHNVVYPEVLSHSSNINTDLPCIDNGLTAINGSEDEENDLNEECQILNERMGGDYDEFGDNSLQPDIEIAQDSHFSYLKPDENFDCSNYNVENSQFEENPIDELHLDDNHTLEDIDNIIMARIESLGYEKSSSEPNTPEDGDCWVHGIIDQLR